MDSEMVAAYIAQVRNALIEYNISVYEDDGSGELKSPLTILYELSQVWCYLEREVK